MIPHSVSKKYIEETLTRDFLLTKFGHNEKDYPYMLSDNTVKTIEKNIDGRLDISMDEAIDKISTIL